MIIDHAYHYLERAFSAKKWQPLMLALPDMLQSTLIDSNNGNFIRWRTFLNQLPQLSPTHIDFNQDVVCVGQGQDVTHDQSAALWSILQGLKPWRKGPFQWFGHDIDAEWRCQLKWSRIEHAIRPLKGKTVLDVGCGNGYYGFRMLGQGAKHVVGLDPSLLYWSQFHCFLYYFWQKKTLGYFTFLPITLEQYPVKTPLFDTIFSMGVLYHRRSPIDHLMELKALLNPVGGELVLETLIIDGSKGQVLTPLSRYAKMPNVWFIPTIDTLETWLSRSGFCDYKLIDVSATTHLEQRATPWSGRQSLSDFLDPRDSAYTIEGYPSPKRAILTAYL